MILYARKNITTGWPELPESDVAPEGFEKKPLEFLIRIMPDGKLALEDMRTQTGKKLIGKAYLLPRHADRTSKSIPSLLWDNLTYVLGYTAT